MMSYVRWYIIIQRHKTAPYLSQLCWNGKLTTPPVLAAQVTAQQADQHGEEAGGEEPWAGLPSAGAVYTRAGQGTQRQDHCLPADPPGGRNRQGQRVFATGSPVFFFTQSKSYQRLKNWYSSSYPARRLVLEGQWWDLLGLCQYAVIGWDGKFDLQVLSQCGSTYNCLSRSVSEIHQYIAGTLSNQPMTLRLGHNN